MIWFFGNRGFILSSGRSGFLLIGHLVGVCFSSLQVLEIRHFTTVCGSSLGKLLQVLQCVACAVFCVFSRAFKRDASYFCCACGSNAGLSICRNKSEATCHRQILRASTFVHACALTPSHTHSRTLAQSMMVEVRLLCWHRLATTRPMEVSVATPSSLSF